MKHAKIIAPLAATAAVLALAAGTADAAPPKVVFTGPGAVTESSTSTVSFLGHASGQPVSGTYTGSVTPTGADFPLAGECVPATAVVRVEDETGRVLQISSDGEVCAFLLPLGVMQRFDGRFRVDVTWQRTLSRSVGALDIRLLNGNSDVYAVSS